MGTILSVQNLHKYFLMHVLGGKRFVGCAGFGFDLKEGELLGITGPSGAGKSTVLKCIYRTYVVSSGYILYQSLKQGLVNLAGAEEQVILRLRREEMSYVSQFLKVMPRVPAVDVLAEGLWRKGEDAESSREAAREYLGRMGIPSELWEAYPSTFSGGQQQRINLSRAMITRPRLLLIDEPTASLDAKAKSVVVRMLKELKDQGTSMVVVYHDLEAMRKLLDRNLIMHEGRCNPVEMRGNAI